ncbi:MAG: ADP-forming succinate--CoA ligase subunit beta [Actinomycetota bacterium]|nr:ADP-forming succinate--CoA ligase subunit beta [Actinomycetota bacterium]
MDLLEYKGKQVLARYGVPQFAGKEASTVDEAVAAAEEVGFPVVVKAQVKIGGRGKLGGIKIAENDDEVREHATNILGMDIRGHSVSEVWIQKATEIESEYYGAVVFDRSAKAPLVMFSTHGGMEIEQVAEEHPEALSMIHIDPLAGFQPYQARRLVYEADVEDDIARQIADMLAKLYEAFTSEEATLVEINPIVITPEREVVALDAKITLDDSSLFRHPDNQDLDESSDADPQEQMAAERGLTYVKLDGDIGIFGNGAGLVMSTLDVVAHAGGAPANFLDGGGGAQAETIAASVEVILSNPNVKAVLFNVFGGITRCDEVAKGIIDAYGMLQPSVPIVVRLDGTNDVEARKLLADADLPNVHPEATMDGAAAKVVELAREAGER